MASLRRYVPVLETIHDYEAAWLSKDVVAGLVLTALLVPQGMAYAELAGLPAATGLYTSILCLLAYAVFGPSRVLVLGPDSSLGPMIAASVLPLVASDGDPSRAVALASLLSILVAVCMIAAGVARLGFVADLFSKPTQVGYMNGLALTILVGQLPKLFGFSVDADSFVGELRGFAEGVADGDAVPEAIAVGATGLVVILVVTRVAPKVPGVLVAVVGAIVASIALDLGSKGVSLVGELPSGLPPLTLPGAGLDEIPLLVAGAVGIALVSLTDTISTSTAFAERHDQDVDPDQEMIGIGAANLGAGLFQGFPVSTSASRSAVAEQAGSRTQLTGVVGAVAIAAMLLLAPGLLRDLPQPILAAVVISASLSLADIPATRRLWHQARADFTISVAAFAGVVLVGVLEGIALAVVISILNVFRRMWWPYRAELGEVDGLAGFHDLAVHPTGRTRPGLALFRFDAPLVFANARAFRDEVRSLVAATPDLRWIVVAAEPITDVDTTAADMLEDLDEELNAQHVHLVFAELKTPVQRKIVRYELTRTIDPRSFFDTLDEAIAAFDALAADGERERP
jgi:high affinity sulfate transporter 1